MTVVLAALVGYLIGGLPTGILICRWVRGVDPRATGSGSSGATNVSRVLGKKWAAAVLLIDMAKGYLPVRFLAQWIAGNEEVALISAVMAVAVVAGHIWTPYARFKGGKGVASAAGAMLAIDPLAVCIALGFWILVFAVGRIVSLSSVLASVAFAVGLIALPGRHRALILAGIVISLLLILTHRANLKRLVRGEEKRFV